MLTKYSNYYCSCNITFIVVVPIVIIRAISERMSLHFIPREAPLLSRKEKSTWFPEREENCLYILFTRHQNCGRSPQQEGALSLVSQNSFKVHTAHLLLCHRKTWKGCFAENVKLCKVSHYRAWKGVLLDLYEKLLDHKPKPFMHSHARCSVALLKTRTHYHNTVS